MLGQLELELDELTSSATEDEFTAETAPGRTTQVKELKRRRQPRKPFPEHLPRECVVVPSPTSCTCCGSKRLSKVGEDVTETLEVIPRRWKVMQTIREKLTCRDCTKVSQTPTPYPAVPRAWAGPNLLATIVHEKHGQHQPLNRQSERYAREGVELSLSTLADQVGACGFALRPRHELIAAHVLGAQGLHGDDTPVPLQAKGTTDTARAWVYVRGYTPFAGRDPPVALFRYSRTHSGSRPVEHLRGLAGLLQTDAYAAFDPPHAPGPVPKPVSEAICSSTVAGRTANSPRPWPPRSAAVSGAGLAAGDQGKQMHRRAVRYPARRQRRTRRAAPRGRSHRGWSSSRAVCPPRARAAIASRSGEEGNDLHGHRTRSHHRLPR